jgi:hypothetical protein
MNDSGLRNVSLRPKIAFSQMVGTCLANRMGNSWRALSALRDRFSGLLKPGSRLTPQQADQIPPEAV